MTASNNTRSRGFTLTELAVVFGVSTALAAGLWGIFAGGNRTFESSTAHIAATRSAVQALAWVRRDLGRLAVPRNHPSHGPAAWPVRFPAPGVMELKVMKALDIDALAPDTATLPVETVTYRFVPVDEPGAGLYRNDTRLSRLPLERFEAALLTDGVSGAPFVKVALTGADPSGRKAVFLRDLVYLDRLHASRRHGSAVPNPLPRLEGTGGPGVPIT